MLTLAQWLLSFVILPLAVFLATLISCGSSRPKHEPVGPDGSKKSTKGSSRKQKTGSSGKSLKMSKTQKTRSTRSKTQSSKTSSRSRKQSSRSMKSSGKSAKIKAERQDLKMEPVELRWNTSGGLQKVFLTNPTNVRRAVKVKCSDNTLYRVNPVYSFIEPGQVLSIDIARQNGGAKVDKMVFVAAMADKNDQNPRAVFQDNTPKPMMVLPLIATNN